MHLGFSLGDARALELDFTMSHLLGLVLSSALLC